jgi:hypothetical protein
MSRKIEFGYDLADDVSIIHLRDKKDNAVKGVIYGLNFCDNGIEYDVVYYVDGERRRDIFFQNEISSDLSDNKHSCGFAK